MSRNLWAWFDICAGPLFRILATTSDSEESEVREKYAKQIRADETSEANFGEFESAPKDEFTSLSSLASRCSAGRRPILPHVGEAVSTARSPRDVENTAAKIQKLL